ncbi:MAG: hypothetical protein H6733_03330 [Alphaproteobacteria bacterium]|nr:hypothetical protein [Alphaproteobacteria bacterium]
MHHRLLALSSLLVAACSVDEDAFPEKVSRTYCAAVKACDLDLFWDTWAEGTPQCRLDVADDVNDQRYGGGGIAACSFDADLADACLSQLQAAGCDEVLDDLWFRDCVDAWDCITVVDPGRP